MSVLSAATQQQVEESLIKDGVISNDQLKTYKTKAAETKTPLLTMLVHEKLISSEQLTKTTAHVTKLPYVNLAEATIDPAILALLPQDIAERYMAVPLGEMQRRLVVAMLDADNVQAVDFLSNKIGRPLKVYAASEEGIRQVLKQYSLSLGEGVADAIENSDAGQELAKDKDGDIQTNKDKNIKTIVQDSPISTTSGSSRKLLLRAAEKE